MALGTLLIPVALATGASPASAAVAELQPLDTSPPPQPLAAPMHNQPRAPSAGLDRALDRLLGPATGARPKAAAAQQNQASGTYQTKDGMSVRVEVTPYLAADRAGVQEYVDFLGSRVHGSELRRLNVAIVTLAELQGTYCAAQALACYVPSREVMFIPGEQLPAGQAPLPYVITHELGHHIANNRRNDPWKAVHWGPKRWASLRNVCLGVRAGRYFPEDQGDRYYMNPGENWAETYAVLHYPGGPWEYDATLQPDPTTLQIAALDVTRPWSRPGAKRHSGRLSRSNRRKTFPVTTTLDGRIALRLTGPKRAQYNLQLYANGQRLRSTRRKGSRDTLNYDACGLRSLQVRVVRKSGSGKFKLSIGTPG